jgi:hypothetical protein
MEEKLQNNIVIGSRDYVKLANDYGEFELPKEIKMAFKAGQGNLFGGCLNRAKIRMFHIQNHINPEDISVLLGMPPERTIGEDFKTYKNRQKLARILFRDRNYLNMLSEVRTQSKTEENAKV